MNNILERVKDKISSAYRVYHVDVIDDSDLHIGHNFSSALPVSHIRVILVSDDFCGIDRLRRQRLLHNLLQNEIEFLHSISFRVYTLKEYELSYFK